MTRLSPILGLVCSVVLFARSGVALANKPVLIGYSAVWRDEAAPPAGYDWASLTHVARAFVRPRPDGALVVPEGYFNPDLETHARQHGVKLLISLGGGGASNADWLSMATIPANRDRFFDNLAKLMAEHHYDGVDVDWEPPEPSKTDGEAYGAFLKALRARFPKAVLTTALPSESTQTRFTPWADVTATVDYVNVMAYDYSGPWSGVAGHASNLFPAGDYAGKPGKSVEEGMKNLIETQHVDPAKLVIGLNFFAYRFRADRIGDAFTKNAPGATDDLTYPQVLGLIRTGKYEAKWDEKAAMSYVQRTGGGGVIACETPESVRRKCDYAKRLGLAGMMVWNVGSDVAATESPLMDVIVQSAGGTPKATPRAAIEGRIAAAAEKVGSPAPADVSKLSIVQLKALDEQLQTKAAVANDAAWQSAASKR